jgi:hypothetical protein
MTSIIATSTDYSDWWLGLTLGFIVTALVVVIVAVVLALAARIADQAEGAAGALDVVRAQTPGLAGIGQINASAIAIRDCARAARKALTGS